MAWTNRLREEIVLTSPEGSVFNALWRGSNRSKEKKLGSFSYPKVKGAFIQDLDIGATRYPMTIYFEGRDNDLEAQKFFSACDETGKWKVVHPVHGNLELQMTSVTEIDDPITSGNITAFELDFVESIDISNITTARQLSGLVGNLVDQCNIVSAQQFANIISQNSFSAIQTIKDVTDSIVTLSDSVLGPLAELSTDVSRLRNAAQRGLQKTLQSTVLASLRLAGQIQEILQLPLLSKRDVESRLGFYENMARSMFNLGPTSANTDGKNLVATNELALSALLASIAKTAVTGEVFTRAQAFNSAARIAQLLDDIQDNLDESQALFKDQDIDKQYFSQSEAYPTIVQMIGLSVAYLLQNAFSLKVEKRFTLATDRAPIEIVISEYGDLGENDSNLDLFIETNMITGNEILLLPKGKEVLVYV